MLQSKPNSQESGAQGIASTDGLSDLQAAPLVPLVRPVAAPEALLPALCAGALVAIAERGWGSIALEGIRRQIERGEERGLEQRITGTFRGVIDELSDFLGVKMPSSSGDELLGDIVRHVRLLGRVAAEDRVTVHMSSGLSSGRFHVDGTEGATSAVRLIRVYAGAPTQYIDPEDLSSPSIFEGYVEGLPGFGEKCLLKEGARIQVAPPDATIAFKLFRSSNAHEGWIHRSPPGAQRRFLVTVTAPVDFE